MNTSVFMYLVNPRKRRNCCKKTILS